MSDPPLAARARRGPGHPGPVRVVRQLSNETSRTEVAESHRVVPSPPAERLTAATVAQWLRQSVAATTTHDDRTGTRPGHRRWRAAAATRDAMLRLSTLVDPTAVIAAAPEELCHAGEFAQATISHVDTAGWTPLATHTRSGDLPPLHVVGERRSFAAAAAAAAAVEESEIVRRRQRTVRTAHDPLSRRSSLIVRLSIGGKSAGLLHAATEPGQIVRPVDAECLHAFAAQLEVVYENSLLRRQLQRSTRELTRMLALAAQAPDLRSPPRIDKESRCVHRPLAHSPTVLDALSSRERQILALVARGATNPEIASELGIATATVKSHAKKLFRKLRVSNRSQAAACFLRAVPNGHDQPHLAGGAAPRG